MAKHVSIDEMSGALARALTSGLQERVDRAVDIGVRYGQIDGEHHKTWVIDQMLRALCGGAYDEVIRRSCEGEDGPQTYGWDTGIAP